jgi:hypothetical protein
VYRIDGERPQVLRGRATIHGDFTPAVPAAFGGARSDSPPALLDCGSMRGRFCRVTLALDAMVRFARQDG